MPMVFLQFYPIDPADFVSLQDAVEKLSLHDASLQVTGVSSLALGSGLSIGFLGVLHAEVVKERLEREFGLELIATSPSVTYEVSTSAGADLEITAPAQLPDPSLIAQIREPITHSVIYSPEEHVGTVMKLCQKHRAELIGSEKRGLRTRLEYRIPLSEIIISFFDELKSATSGYASLEYQVIGFEPVDAVKLDILINKEPIEALSSIVIKEQADQAGRAIVKKLKEVLPRQMFEVPIQAAIGGTVVARETVKAFRKDVTAKLYGGDVTRRKKLLSKQAKGKKKMKAIGKVELPQEAFMAVLSR
jgi:GTP-binding protein LepA